MWQRIRIDCEWTGAPSIRGLFEKERAVLAILEFPEKTRVGKMPSRILLAGGPDLEEEEMDTLSLQVLDEEGGSDVSASEEEEGPGPPL